MMNVVISIIKWAIFGCQFMIGERKICIVMDQHARLVRPAPLQSVKSMAMSAMAVECE